MSEQNKTPLELAYSPSSCAPLYEQHIVDYRVRGRGAISSGLLKKVAYGQHEDEWFWSGASAQSKRVFVFIHGGYWQFLSASDAVFFAQGLGEQGIDSVSVNYTLAPQADLKTIVDQCVRALQTLIYLYPNAQLVISGSSAGAHLTAMLFSRTELMASLNKQLSGVLLCSGVFDLRPLVNTYVNDALQLTTESALALSPLYLPVLSHAPVCIVYGAQETDAFKGQSRHYKYYLDSLRLPSTLFEIKQRNHFDIVFDFDQPHCIVGQFISQSFS
jgi:arylformamidase